MHDQQIRITRETILWGAIVSVGAAVLSVSGFPVAPMSVALGASFAVIAVKFYGTVVQLLFRLEGSAFQFGVWFSIKIASLIVLCLMAMESSVGEIGSFVVGSLVFVPAAFRYAIREAQNDPEPPPADESSEGTTPQ